MKTLNQIVANKFFKSTDSAISELGSSMILEEDENQAGTSAMDTENTGDYKVLTRDQKKKDFEDFTDKELAEEDIDLDNTMYDIHDDTMEKMSAFVAGGITDDDDDEWDDDDDECPFTSEDYSSESELSPEYTEELEEFVNRYAGTEAPSRLDTKIEITEDTDEDEGLEEDVNPYEKGSFEYFIFEEDQSISERVRAKKKKARKMKQMKGKMKAGRRRKKTRMDMKTIKKRVRTQAIKLVKEIFAKKMGSSYSNMNASQQAMVDKKVEKKSALIERKAKKLLKQYRSKQMKSKSTTEKDSK